MANASRPPICSIVWMWKSNAHPFCSSELAEWTAYSCIETAIIEEAYQAKRPNVLLDDYHIDLDKRVQTYNYDLNKRRPIQRIVDESDAKRVRQERFSYNPISPDMPFSFDSHCLPQPVRFLTKVTEYFGVDYYQLLDSGVRKMFVERASQGLVQEAQKLSKCREGEWIAEQLLKAKDHTMVELWTCCARLYTMDTFVFRKMNEIMRLVQDAEREAMWSSKVATFGPFAFLLREASPSKVNKLTVYRGVNLSDDQLQRFQEEYNTSPRYSFQAFTSTSQNRALAELFGNTLFIIKTGSQLAFDLSLYSQFPDEEEVLLAPGFEFFVERLTFNAISNKHELYLEGEDWDP